MKLYYEIRIMQCYSTSIGNTSGISHNFLSGFAADSSRLSKLHLHGGPDDFLIKSLNWYSDFVVSLFVSL